MTEQPLIGPVPKFPTPWTVFRRTDTEAAIWPAEGESPVVDNVDPDVAEFIIRLVNREADPGMVDMLEANEALQELAGQLAEAHAEIERMRATLLAAGVIELDLAQIPAHLRLSDVQRTFRAAGLKMRFEVDEQQVDEPAAEEAAGGDP